MGLRVGVVFGGRSTEHKVSVDSGRAVAEALAEAGHEVIPLGVAQDGCWVDAAESVAALEGRIDLMPALGEPVPRTLGRLLECGAQVLFPIIHGTWGEDGSLQGLFEMLDLPYVGCGVSPSAVAMDKVLTKIVLERAGIPVVEFVAVGGSDLPPAGLPAPLETVRPPVFVKPVVGGSSVGVRKVARLEELEEAVRFALEFDDRVLVERAVSGRELECAVLGYGTYEAAEVGEIVPGGEFYDYADKYLEDKAGLHAPADLDPELRESVRRLAVAAFAAVGGWGMARVDFLVEEGKPPYVNELNTLPGFTDISMYPKLWEVAGLPLPRLVDRLVQIALQRHADRRRLDRGIKDWLASQEE